MIVYRNGNMFKDINEYDYIAHCISSDAVMGKGFAKSICHEFNGLRNSTKSDIANRKLVVGDISIISIISSSTMLGVINLITKEKYYNKPTYVSLRTTIDKMKNYCSDNNIKRIKIPKIGSGYDKLNWEKVLKILIEKFNHSDITLIIYL